MHNLILALPAPDQGPAAPDGGSGGGMNSILFFLLPILILFVLMPLFNKKEKHRRKRLGELKKHDRVVTSGGIYCTVISLDETTAVVEVAKDVRMKVKRSSIFDIERPQDAAKDSDRPARKAGAKS